jgi:hypothetical protein
VHRRILRSIEAGECAGEDAVGTRGEATGYCESICNGWIEIDESGQIAITVGDEGTEAELAGFGVPARQDVADIQDAGAREGSRCRGYKGLLKALTGSKRQYFASGAFTHQKAIRLKHENSRRWIRENESSLPFRLKRLQDRLAPAGSRPSHARRSAPKNTCYANP